MKLKAVICFLLLLLTYEANALSVFAGHSLFFVPKADALSPYIEVYWQIDARSLHFENNEGQWTARVKVDVALSNDTGILNEDHFTLQTPPVSDKHLAESQVIIDLRRYSLKAGGAKLQITFTEVGQAGNTYIYADSFTVPAPTDKITMSKPQLIDTAYSSKMESPFLRNGMQHIPLSIPFVDDYRGAMNYYLELYGLKKESLYILSVFVSKKPDDNAVSKLLKTDTLQAGQIVPYYGTFAVSALPSGNYYLNASLQDRYGKELSRSSLFFQRASKKPVQDTTGIRSNEFDTTAQKDVYVFNISKTFVAKYNHAQLKAMLKMLLPIADGPERMNIYAFLGKPDETNTRYFIYNFWLGKDRRRPEKEWEKYADRVREVNKLFGSSGTPGYETERGLTYLKYGKPNERIVVNSEQGALPYEVWQYFNVGMQGKDGVFLFYSPGNMANDYRMLHSTVTGEARDMNWRATLYPNGRRDNTDSKAEQYLRNR